MYSLDQPDKSEYPVLLEIWEASVRATHHFLSEQDIAFYKTLILDHEVFKQVQLTTVRNTEKEITGFMGVADGKLEMLFLHPDARGKGLGRLLLQHAIKELQVQKVDVNEQNEQALAFYQHAGFRVASRSELDGTGKPFPILHLTL